MQRARSSSTAILLWLAASCGHDADATPQQPGTLRHDFGTLAHGTVAEHEFEVQRPGGLAGWYPRGWRTGCTCAIATLTIAGKDGQTRSAGFVPPAQKTLAEGERLLLKLAVDTRLKEAADQPPLTTHGEILLADLAEKHEQVVVPVSYTFAIDAPVRVLPFPHIDIGLLERAGRFRQTLELAGDERHPGVRFGPVQTSDPRLRASLVAEAETQALAVEFVPGGGEFSGPLPPMRIEVATDLPGGYTVSIPVTAAILPLFSIEPPQGISFDRIDLAREHDGFANVLDHDLDHPPELVVLRIKDRNGASLDQHFAARVEKLQGLPRGLRVHLRYLGKLTGSFFGAIELARPGRGAAVVEVEFRGFPK
jgi:hypothetical protein